MKRVILFQIVVCIVFMTSVLASAQTQVSASSTQVTVSAKGGGDNPGSITVKPTLSVGCLTNLGDTEYTLTAHGSGIGGVTKRSYDYETSAAVYLAAGLPFTYDRFEATLSGSWAIPAGSSDVKERDFAGALLGGRTWKTETTWSTGDLRLSYAIVKDFNFIKAVAPIGGLRYDYWKTKYDDPHKVSSAFAVAAPWDKAEFHTSALLPYIGFKAVIGGLKTGAIGGDLELGAIGGWTAWGKVKHYETRDLIGTRHDTFKGDLRGSGSLFDFGEFSADYTVFSFAPSQKIQGSLSLFVKYNLFTGEGSLDGVRVVSGERDKFDFEIDRSSATAGINFALKF